METKLVNKYQILLQSLIIFGLITLTFCVQRTFEEAKLERDNLVKKYLKKLKKEDGAIKLVGGKGDHEGNVEILHNSKWGAVCDDEWDQNEAEVVCRQLGYPGFVKVTHSGAFGKAKRRYWMDNMFCSGKELGLADCKFDGWGQSDCEANESAGVICKDVKNTTEIPKLNPKRSKHKLALKEKMEIRLTGGRIKEEGRVEIRFGSGSWGAICGDGWSLLEGNVVCQQLGLGYANDAMQTDFFGGANVSKIMLSGTECYGNESSLAECFHHEIGSRSTCSEKTNHVAVVTCVSKMADLVFDHVEMEQSLHLEDKLMYLLQCAMEENCLASQAYEIQRDNPNWHLETRRLLKFTARVVNTGTADFRPHIPKHLWEWHLCHMHYHSMEVFATFDITNNDGIKVAEGHKASFCLEDNQCLYGIEPKYACANYGDQGISVNCSDIYRHNIDCQWVDISEMDFGTYTFKVSINPEFKVPEMSFDNNAVVCTLVYTETYARVFNCKMQRP